MNQAQLIAGLKARIDKLEAINVDLYKQLASAYSDRDHYRDLLDELQPIAEKTAVVSPT